MKTAKERSLAKRIDAYLRGDLDGAESEQLWVDLLQHPEYIEYLETEAALRFLIGSRRR